MVTFCHVFGLMFLYDKDLLFCVSKFGVSLNIWLISIPYTRVRAALLKIKSTTYKLFFAIFLTTVLL